MNTVLFIMRYPLVDVDTLKPKFDGQIQAVKNLGYDVFFVAYDHEYSYLIHDEDKMPIKRIKFADVRGYKHTFAYYDMFDTVKKVLKDHHFDYIYMRTCPMSLKGFRMCQQIKKDKRSKWSIEIPTYPATGEKPSSRLRAIYGYYSEFFWNRIGGKCDLYTLIGESAENYRGVKAINIENGICVEQLKPKKNIQKKDGKIHFLAVASMSVWHGFDRVIEGLHQADAQIRSQVVFDMVGNGGDGSLFKWKKMVDKYELHDCVRFYEYKEGSELDEMFDIADIGICSLGLYRSDCSRSSILKLREYTGRGLPFVYAADDLSLPENVTWCMRISNDDLPVDIGEVLAFARNVSGDIDLSNQMIQYAKENMGWEKQFRRVFEVLE